MASSRQRIGTELLGYWIEDLLARGGMGEVYRAEDLRLKRKVALKLLAPELSEDDRFRSRFLRESELAASLEHPGIVPIYEAGEHEGQLYIAMRYVDGTDLETLLRREAPLEPERALALVSQVGDALDAAHERGLVHRDVKPSNVLIAVHGGREHCYLADFGLTKKTSSQSGYTLTGELIGTVDYIAPEQIRGDLVDGRADLYSLGCLFYECLTGEPPFTRASEVAVIYAHLEGQPKRATAGRPALPAAIDDVLAKAMAKLPAERYATCREFVDAAGAALGLTLLTGVPAGRGRRSLLSAGATVLVLVLAAAGALTYFLTRGDSASPRPLAAGDLLVAIDPATNEVADQFPIGSAPSAIAVGKGRVWVANGVDRTISTLDPDSGEETDRVGLSAGTAALVVGGEFAWAADEREPNAVWKINGLGWVSHAADLPWRRPRYSHQQPPDRFYPVMAYGFKSLWVAQGLHGAPLQRIGAPSPERGVVPGNCLPFGLAAGEGAVWLACAHGLVVRVDPATNRRVATTKVGSSLGGIAAGAGAVWVTDVFESVVWRIDPRRGRPVRTISVDGTPAHVVVGEGAVWVITRGDPDTVSRIDPATNRVVATIPVGFDARAIAVGEGRIWVTTETLGSSSGA